MTNASGTQDSQPSPAELRKIFGANLRILADRYPSVSQLCRELGINRTQFNRYLSGESFPRPDVLHRMCQFFDVDARILLEPINSLSTERGVLNHPLIADFVGTGMTDIPQDVFPDGFYRFSRLSFTEADLIIIGLVYVFRQDKHTFIRGYEAKEGMRQQGLPTDQKTREFRGVVLPQEDGLAALVSHKNTMATSFNYLSRVASFQNHYWIGYATRTVRETVTGCRAARLVYEHLGSDTGAVLSAARSVGFCKPDELIPYHRKLLQLDRPFS
ncbi:helix-turn-helix transcriptional regulator [uncultured Shimia sp.]|uniref:helix-turn-helix domain-containing protein n=1 Tax=uncultured Shimia sp. TaxID=573152 RepID=UPI0026326544|nr:helix-turn-helix transcriptional regulator [uncultured Shimia sp.]